MTWEASDTNEFLRDHEKRKQPSNIPSINPLPDLSDDNQTKKRRRTLSDRSGSSSRVYDYGRSQSDLMPPSSPQNGTNDKPLLGVDTRDSSTLADLLCGAMVPQFVKEKAKKRAKEGTKQETKEGTKQETEEEPEEEPEESKEWLPRTALWQICQRPNVTRELTTVFDESYVPMYLDYVLGNQSGTTRTRRSARMIFAILVLIKELGKLDRFFKAGLCDEDLPFKRDNDGILQPRAPVDNQSSKRETCFRMGETSFMRSFQREQWQIKIPFIYRPEKNHVLEFQLHSKTVMPWTACESVERNGGFAKVYMVKIHPDHHAFDEYDTFALKVLRSTGQETCQEEFQRELYALRKTPPGPHVIELLATFKRGEEHSFLFPWADEGNLADLMVKKPSDLLRPGPDASRILIQWLANQCAGIAEGLHGMHNAKPTVRNNDNSDKNDSDKDEWKDNYGIHGDLKPENILRFRRGELGELRLSDFGLTKFHTIASRSKQPGNGPMSPTYASPEQTKDFLYVSRRSDVWALGCVFSMLLTWAIRGREAVKLYDKARHDEKDPGRKRTWYEDTFYGTEHDQDGEPMIPHGFFLKKAVIDCIEENKKVVLESYPESSYLIEFLDFIRYRMLEINSDKRVTSEKVCEFLKVKMRENEWANRPITLPTLREFS
ncbi:hypothetical protein Neosp_005390 [[Neocosmospora] mangrovei]